jgi:8-oxo-dGTP pyrophosphatase MutT (NUDIX family)
VTLETPPSFPGRIHQIIEKINWRPEGQPSPPGRAPHGGNYGDFDPAFKLNLHWLAELVSRQMSYHEPKENLYRMMRPRQRVLPANPVTRQHVLESFQLVLARCARQALLPLDPSRDPVDFDLVKEFQGEGFIAPSLHQFGFNPEDLGFFWISAWNPERILREENVGGIEKVSRAEYNARHRPVAGWIRDQELYDRLLAEAQAARMGQPCPALVAVEPDEMEGGRSDQLYLKVSKSIYSQHVALRNYMRADHGAYEQLRRRIAEHHYADGRTEDLDDIIRVAPESNIVINVTVQSANGRVMLIRRPTKTRVWRSFYQAGAHETMNWPGASEEKVEDWFQLARRALREEIGLTDPADYYSKIVFSWFGFYAIEASGYFFSHVRTRLSEAELVAAVAGCPGVIEADAIEWMDLDRASVYSVVQTWRNGPWEESTLPDVEGRRWLPHATLSLTQLLRVTEQGMLDPPYRL